MSLLARRGRRAESDAELAQHVVGNALVVYPKERMTEEAHALAQAVARDEEYDLVVVDLPAGVPISTWESVADALPRRGRRGIRLVMGNRSRESSAMAGQWLAERLGRTVLAPDGVVVRGAGGSLFVDSGKGSGWVRFQPGRASVWVAKRFPRPSWDSRAVAEMWTTGDGTVAEPLPGGVWLRSATRPDVIEPHRARLVGELPCQPDLMTVVVGCPGTDPVAVEDVAGFALRLDEELRGRIRFVLYGTTTVDRASFGQSLADVMAEEAACYTGIPVGGANDPEIHAIGADGEPGRRLYARDVVYVPRSAGLEPPRLLTHRQPVAAVEPLGNGVYWYAPDAVLEVVQAGLWMRPPYQAHGAASVRAVPAEPGRNLVIYDDENTERAIRMRRLAEDAIGHLELPIRSRSAVVAASEVATPVQVTVKPRPAMATMAPEPVVRSESAAEARSTPVGEPASPATLRVPLERPTLPGSSPVLEPPSAPALRPAASLSGVQPAEVPPGPVPAALPTTVRVGPAAVPETEKPVVPAPAVSQPLRGAAREMRWQPTPDAAAAAVLTADGPVAEREWFRRTLSAEFDVHSNAIARVFSEHPGLVRGTTPAAEQDALVDAAAVRLYLTGQGHAINSGLRAGRPGPHVPFARCVVSGLGRLPSHRGPCTYTTTMTDQQWQLYSGRKLLTEWGFLDALVEPCAEQKGDVDVLLWSMTARRTKALELEDGSKVPDRVVFAPGTSFKLLDAVPPAGDGTRGRLLLREIGAAEIDAKGRVNQNRMSLDELATESLHRCVERWAGAALRPKVGPASASRFAALPGLVEEVR